ncbi:MAG: exonuclease SbcCD subunit D [Oscillospiraceae bacterium]|jgi:exonuclease SbcD|nr:exonuclease SbcCD subunit D [Oscillospiraceae bacterium]
MKFFHISDLHLGKRVNEFSMIENQSDILDKIAALAEENKPSAVLVAGDVYDKSMPTVEAMQLLDRFLVRLAKLGIAVFMISGNHDSVERISFAAELLKQGNVHIAQSYDGNLSPVRLGDEFGCINIWMMPYLKPSSVRPFFPETAIESYSDAVFAALGNIELDSEARNILVAHQFVTGAQLSEGSEELAVGGLENIDGSLFDRFDYVALGHIHRPQNIGRETMRYSGTPLKYSLSEANQQKSVAVVEMKNKGDISISQLLLAPLREMRKIRGKYGELMSRSHYLGLDIENDYFHVVLTDERDEPDALAKLRNVYKNIISFAYDNTRTRTDSVLEKIINLDTKKPAELFGDLFVAQNGRPMDAEQAEYVRGLFEKIWGEDGK